MENSKTKLYEALVDAVNKSPHFNNIPLPAILDNQLEELIVKYGYDKVPEDAKPKFDNNKKEEKEESEYPSILTIKQDLQKKLKDKLKGLQKKRDRHPKKTLL